MYVQERQGARRLVGPGATAAFYRWPVDIEGHQQTRGDSYLRTLLIHGGRTVVRVADKYQDRKNRWVSDVDQRRGKNIAAVAVANKNARIAWALLSKKTTYQAVAA